MASVDFFTGFTYKWAQTGAVFDWQDDQYKLGWATIGSTPPTVEQFNRVLQVSDEKSNWLYGQLKTVADAKSVTLSAGSLTGLQQVLAAYTPDATETVKGIAAIATNTEVGAATNDTKFVTPLKLGNFFTSRFIQATEAALGVLKLATQAQTNAGTDDTTAVTPKKLRFGFAASFGPSGYLTLPTWMGGLIFQWGIGTISLTTTSGIYYTGNVTLNLPIPFSATPYFCLPTIQKTPNALNTISSNGFSSTQVQFSGCTSNESPQTPSIYYFAVGK
jgi:hypothetical protein